MKTTLKKNLTPLFSILFLSLLLVSFKIKNEGNKNYREELETNRDSITTELKFQLNKIFELWYPLSIDTVYGGFYSDINYKWELSGKQNKMIVTQARHVWTNSNAAMYYPDKSKYLQIAEHGYKFLKNVMLDKDYGGFYNLVSRSGKPFKDNGEIIKQAYGNAFAIYGLAAYYKATGDTSALNLAIQTFNWLDKHSYDPKYGGYFQFMHRDGTPFINGYRNVPPKDQNSSIHILECFTELYKVWPNPVLKERLKSLLFLIRDKMIYKQEYLQLFFNRDLTPVSYRDSSEAARKKNFELDHISFGHNVETAYLMMEACGVLGIKNYYKTLMVGKRMDDFALANGWDKKHGGIYDGGYIFKGDKKVKIVKDTKEWWSQVEAMNSFLMMSEYFPHDKINYYGKFCLQWQYVKKYLLDNVYGGWFFDSIDTAPSMKTYPKGSIWKGNYHTSRGLINCIRRLEGKM